MAEPTARRRSLLADTRPLRESPPFRRLWIGTTVSSLGSAMTSFALILQTYDLTRSSVAVGAIGLAQVLPILVLGLFGGSFADAVDRRRLVLITSGGLTVVSAVFAVQAFSACASSGCSTCWPRWRPRCSPSTARPAARSCRGWCPGSGSQPVSRSP